MKQFLFLLVIFVSACYEEGILRLNYNNPVSRRDCIVLSILKTEWFQEIKQHLSEKIK